MKASLWASVFAGVATALFAFISGYVGYELADAVGKASEEKVAAARVIAESAKVDVARSNERVAELGKEAAQLAAETEASRAEIAKANARAVEAQLALEKYKAPRLIEADVAEDIFRSLKPYSVAGITVGASPMTFESAFLRDALEAIFRRLGLKTSSNDDAIAVDIGVAKGIVIVFTKGNTKGAAFARALASVLSKHDIRAAAYPELAEAIVDIENQKTKTTREDDRWSSVAVGVGDKF